MELIQQHCTKTLLKTEQLICITDIRQGSDQLSSQLVFFFYFHLSLKAISKEKSQAKSFLQSLKGGTEQNGFSIFSPAPQTQEVENQSLENICYDPTLCFIL